MAKPNFIIITGQEGAGKSTICRALLPLINNSAQIDAEDVGQTNPWEMNEAFVHLLWQNVITLIKNFLAAGYTNIITASFFSSYEELQRFKGQLGLEATMYVIQLCASKGARDERRINRAKPTKKEWRDWGDENYPEDMTLREHTDEYNYVRIDSTDMTTEGVITTIKEAFPNLF